MFSDVTDTVADIVQHLSFIWYNSKNGKVVRLTTNFKQFFYDNLQRLDNT